MRLGELIAVARECKGWTLRDLEKQAGVSNALISQIETSKVKDPGFATMVRLCDALGLSLDRAARTARPPVEALRERSTIIGKVTGKPREGDQCPGMPNAICHGCGLGYRCSDPDCPNDKPNPMFPWSGFADRSGPVGV